MTTAATDIPLGRLEDQRLEFKSRDALKNPEKIAREVVAMLNAEGGEVWIGLREEDGRAMEIEPIRDTESAKDRLHDHLVDTLEPAPTGEEVVIEVVELPGGKRPARILRIVVRPSPGRAPYAWLKRSGRHFEIRFGRRLRPMSREEIRGAISSSDEEPRKQDEDRAAERALFKAREDLIAEGSQGLWLSVRAAPELSLDLRSDRTLRIATEPELTGNRRTGATFIASHQPDVKLESIEWEGGGFSRARIFETGHADFFTRLITLFSPGSYIQRLALAEYPTSALRILSQLFAEARGDFVVLADLALVGVKNCGLRPQTPFERELRLPKPVQPINGPDLFLDKPLRFQRREIIEQPDLCAARLLSPIFEGFGEELPREFDFRSGRLILPE